MILRGEAHEARDGRAQRFGLPSRHRRLPDEQPQGARLHFFGCWHWNDWYDWYDLWQLRMAGVSGWSYAHSHSPSLDAWQPLRQQRFLGGKTHVIPFLGWLSGQSHPDSPRGLESASDD